MKKVFTLTLALVLSAVVLTNALAADAKVEKVTDADKFSHPDSSQWDDLIAKDLSNTQGGGGVWKWEPDGTLTSTRDVILWTKDTYGNATIDLEFKLDKDTNGGVIVYASDIKKNWPANCVEIQVADDRGKWQKQPRSWQCAAAFGHLGAKFGPNGETLVKKPGEWNRMTITCEGKNITAALNGYVVTRLDMSKWTSAKKNPDGSGIPGWLSKPKAELPIKGVIGLQGKHGPAPVWYRNLKIKAKK